MRRSEDGDRESAEILANNTPSVDRWADTKWIVMMPASSPFSAGPDTQQAREIKKSSFSKRGKFEKGSATLSGSAVDAGWAVRSAEYT